MILVLPTTVRTCISLTPFVPWSSFSLASVKLLALTVSSGLRPMTWPAHIAMFQWGQATIAMPMWVFTIARRDVLRSTGCVPCPLVRLSVYCFLRLARCLYSLAVRGLHLLTTKFYDDFILASKPGLCESSKNSMELLFMLTGWLFAKDGKKSTSFSCHCNALGVEFDFSRSEQRLLAVANTALRKEGLVRQITAALDRHTWQTGMPHAEGQAWFCWQLPSWKSWESGAEEVDWPCVWKK